MRHVTSVNLPCGSRVSVGAVGPDWSRVWWDGPMPVPQPFPPDATLADAGEFGLISALVDLFPQGEQSI